MEYRLFLYKTASGLGHCMIDAAICDGSWKDCANYLKDFNVSKIKNLIEEKIGEHCSVDILLTTGRIRRRYLGITTSYKDVEAIIRKLYAIAVDNALVMYDAERDVCLAQELVDANNIAVVCRNEEITNALIKTIGACKVKDLPTRDMKSYKRATAKVFIVDQEERCFEDIRWDFIRCLQRNLKENEIFNCDKLCMTIESEKYLLTYCLEKGASYGRGQGRTGIEFAYKQFDKFAKEGQKDILKRMCFAEMCRHFPNPVDRFVKSIAISRWQSKQWFGIRYSGFGYYGAEILFYLDVNRKDNATVSVLKIEEESASFILPFIEDIYPYFYDRYYCTDNHLPVQMWKDILKRISEAKEMILYDTFNPALKKYIKHFCLSELTESYVHDSDKVQVVFKNREKIAHLYDVFIYWSQEQFNCCDEQDDMFNIYGP